MTTTDRTTEPAGVFDAHLARWEAAEADPDGTVERVARAIYDSDNFGTDWEGESEHLRDEYRINARAAIDALRPAPVVQPADQPAPDTTAGDALREAIAGGLRAVAHWCQHDPCTPCLIISDEEFDAQIEVTAMRGSTPTRIEGKPEAIADALLSGPLAQLHADAAELRAKVQRVRALHNDTRNRGICAECSDDVAVGWPCSTIDALEGKP